MTTSRAALALVLSAVGCTRAPAPPAPGQKPDIKLWNAVLERHRGGAAQVVSTADTIEYWHASGAMHATSVDAGFPARGASLQALSLRGTPAPASAEAPLGLSLHLSDGTHVVSADASLRTGKDGRQTVRGAHRTALRRENVSTTGSGFELDVNSEALELHGPVESRFGGAP